MVNTRAAGSTMKLMSGLRAEQPCGVIQMKTEFNSLARCKTLSSSSASIHDNGHPLHRAGSMNSKPEVSCAAPSSSRKVSSYGGTTSQITPPKEQVEAKIPTYQLRGDSECGCPTCHRVFSSERAFDLHRMGDYSVGRKCAENLPSVGLELDSRGRWRVPR